jgi:NTP pyrophosphatase (non-canonical NTP hydrolase)
MKLTFEHLSAMNSLRAKQWTTSGGDPTSLTFAATELAGEVGELCNAIKKLERLRLGMAGGKDTTENIKEELGDVVICVDLLARKLNIDLGQSVIDKFNATSRKHGFTITIGGQQ